MENQKQSKFKIVLPVLFTFGASLMFSQASVHADSTQPANNDNQVVTNNANLQNNNYQQTPQQAEATTRTTNAVSVNNYPVSLADSNVQSAVDKPAVNVTPVLTASQYNVTADPINAANGGSGSANLNTAGLTPYQKAFLDSVHDGAISTWKQYGVLPSLTASQAIIESGWGQSSLASQYHNLFGIKGSYNGHSVTLPTREVYGGQSVMINDAFRAYDNNSQSVQDHGYFLVANSRYHNLLWKTNYRDVTYLIRADGYATAPNYTSTLNSVIERYNLTAWDNEAFDTNTGHIDNLSVDGDKVHLVGWHAANSYNQKMHHFIILLDGNSKQELYRTEVNGAYRQDVQNAYPNADISGWGGFNITIPFTSNLTGKNIQVVSRYTYDGAGEPNGGKDLFYNPISLNANAGYLDNMSLDAANGTINISGWHAADNSLTQKYHYLIVYDTSKQTELGRFLVENNNRNDVAQVYTGIYDAANSGFNLNLKFNPALVNDQIQIISRYSDSQDGEENYTDYWFAPKTFNDNNANLDTFTVTGNQVTLSGWHAANPAANKPFHFIILYDATTKQEIKRVASLATSRPDVMAVYPNLYNADRSGFNTTIDLTPEINDHQIQVISRYSDSLDGEGDYIDYWFKPVKLTLD